MNMNNNSNYNYNKKNKNSGYTEFKIHSGIYGKVTRFGLEIYDWGFFIFWTMFSILLFKKIIIFAILLDISALIFLKKYKKNKPDFYTSSLLAYIFIKKELFVLEPEKDKFIS